MGYLEQNISENLAARITNKGRKKIAEGNFSLSYFQIGDSEFDYNFSDFDGDINPPQKILSPFDKDNIIKYPYKFSESTITGTTFGVPIQSSLTETIKNNMGAAGYVSEFIEFDNSTGLGTILYGEYEEIDIANINGTIYLNLPTGSTFINSEYISIYYNELGINNVITTGSTSVSYKIIEYTSGSTGNTITLDRSLPDLSSLSPKTIIVIDNHYSVSSTTPEDQQDSWNVSNVWSSKPAGLDYPTEDERLSGYTENVYVSSKEFFGYGTSTGQTSNTGTTITNSFGDNIIVSPEEQHSISIIHYSKLADVLTDVDLPFKYEDYIGHTTTDDIEYFEIYIPFMFYDRNSGTTIGAKFTMGDVDYYINSSATDVKLNELKYRYLIDEFGNNVGKIFVNHNLVIFDDQEIVACLDYKTNRRHTLPIPRVTLIPTDSKCDEDGDILNPLLSGSTNETVYVSYLFEYTGDTAMNGLHCNYYPKVDVGVIDGDISIKFNSNDFKFMKASLSGYTEGYIANKMYVLVQKTNTGEQPDPSLWRIIDVTGEIPNHTVGDIIDPTNLRSSRFIITYSDYDNADRYDLEDYLGAQPDEPSSSPQFGDSQYFTGSIKLTRSIDLQVMRYLINLPSTDFMTTQNPTYSTGKDKRITEVGLLDNNRDILVIAKTSSPIKRVGNQVLSVKIDI